MIFSLLCHEVNIDPLFDSGMTMYFEESTIKQSEIKHEKR
jgi:hypothetical protein